ncbi:hypothetical protein EGM87_22795 [Sphingobium sp. RSMS]|uniref:hypothetical protein n=1 Tax=Sphingobium sp. RSMS TaxID=520734 RepID=UPI0010F9EF5A|nr:hypothetical protein [Sphingobium sp. RSMS]UXC93127.1 hypothetical protein EGM87_22795 [Sphingobium sp. RSMS]
MASQLGICNEALSEIAADPINSIEEASSSAFYCRMHYASVLEELLGWTDWDWAIRRVTLAAQANDRLGEWLYRYAKPTGMAEALRVLPTVTQQVTGLPVVGPFPFPAWDALGKLPFAMAAGSIYTNVADAILEYQINAVDPAVIDRFAARAASLELAARLAMPLKKSRELKGDMIKQAELAKQRAVAESENRQPRSQTDYVSTVEYARMGLIDGL